MRPPGYPHDLLLAEGLYLERRPAAAPSCHARAVAPSSGLKANSPSHYSHDPTSTLLSRAHGCASCLVASQSCIPTRHEGMSCTGSFIFPHRTVAASARFVVRTYVLFYSSPHTSPNGHSHSIERLCPSAMRTQRRASLPTIVVHSRSTMTLSVSHDINALTFLLWHVSRLSAGVCSHVVRSLAPTPTTQYPEMARC